MKPFSSWTSLGWTCVLVLGSVFISPRSGLAQTKTDATPAEPSTAIPDYPTDRPGILIEGADWAAIDVAAPSKIRAKGGIAQSLTYGAVRGTGVADYTGEHAAVQVKPARVLICICRLTSIPGDPILVKLHPQKGVRELDGGKLAVFGGKVAEATKSDLIPAEVTHPDKTVWLVQSKEALPAGEYALMLGAQNMAIFPFTISATSSDSSNPTGGSH